MRRMHISGSGRIGVCPKPLVKLSGRINIAMREYNNEGGWCSMKTYGSRVKGRRKKRGESTMVKGVIFSGASCLTALAVGGVPATRDWKEAWWKSHL